MSLALSLARRRWLRRLLKPLLRKPRVLQFKNGRRMAISLTDLRGPSFHMGYHYRRPERALDSFEAEGRRWVEASLRKAGDTAVFLDIGANIGIFSFSARSALPGITVYGFEPHPRNAECFSLTAKLNGWKNVFLENIALGESEGEINLYLDESDAGGHSIFLDNLWNNQASTQAIRVPISTLDSWCHRHALTRLDVIKMDVQGAEAAVIRGGQEALARFRPSLLVELQHEHLAEPESFITALEALPFTYRVTNLAGETGDMNKLREWAKEGFARKVLFGDYFFTPVDPAASLTR